MSSSNHYIFYFFIRFFSAFVRLLPITAALWLGRWIGLVAYYFDIKHKTIAYGNLKIVFAESKSPNEIKRITKEFFINYGQNLIELFRLPLMNAQRFEEYVKVEGKEHITGSLEKGKGVILLAMHFGSWELASLSCAFFDRPYKVIVKPQKKNSKLDELLNSYRSCGGSVVLSRGTGTRDLIKSLQNNEIVGMVVDQGGRDGVLVPFLGRQASMSVGAIRLGLKYDIPISFSIIIRDKGPYHRMIMHEPMKLERTGDVEADVITNLNKVIKTMEGYIYQHPSEYMWFYKIWKYSKQSNIVILTDGKAGHLQQSKTVAKMIEKALSERNISATVKTLTVTFKSRFTARFLSLLSLLVNSLIYQGRLEVLKWFLTEASFKELMSIKADFIVSCGSSVAGINYLLAHDQQAKNVAILKPGLLSYKRFDLVVLPQHDQVSFSSSNGSLVVTKGAPNLVDDDFLTEQSRLLLKRYSHLKFRQRFKIGLLLGGDTKGYSLNEQQIKIVVNQLKEVSEEVNADILVTTSRRTPIRVENMLQRELKKHSRCPLLILASRNNIPEAMGGILGLADVIVVSSDSISMVSEAASSGKTTIVFPAQRKFTLGPAKHTRFISQLNTQGYVATSDAKSIGQVINNVAKNKMQTKRLSDQETILEAVRRVI